MSTPTIPPLPELPAHFDAESIYSANEMRTHALQAIEADRAARWQPIETAPKDGTTMFVVRAFRVCNGFTGGSEYTSDPWCVWHDIGDGSFPRWPHHFPPTHWCALPEPPAVIAAGKE